MSDRQKEDAAIARLSKSLSKEQFDDMLWLLHMSHMRGIQHGKRRYLDMLCEVIEAPSISEQETEKCK